METLEEGKPTKAGWIRTLVCGGCGVTRLAKSPEDQEIWKLSVKEDRAVRHSEVASEEMHFEFGSDIGIGPKMEKEKGETSGGDHDV